MPWIQSRKKSSGGGGTPIPYVAAYGRQYIQLPFYSDDNPYVVLKMMTTSPVNQQVYFGDSLFNVNSFILYCDNSSASIDLRYSTGNSVLHATNVQWGKVVDVEIDYSNGVLKYDGVTYTINSGHPSNTF